MFVLLLISEFLLVSLFSRHHVVDGQFDTPLPPSDLTVPSNSQAIFNCTYPSQSSSQTLTWTKSGPGSSSTAAVSKMFDSPSYLFRNATSTAFAIDGRYNLVLPSANPMTDGGSYGCSLTGIPTTHWANLVIIDELNFAINPSNPLMAGSPSNITGYVSYGGPPSSSDSSAAKPLDSSQLPKLRLSIGSTDVTSNATMMSSSAAQLNYHIISLTLLFNASAADSGKNISLTVTSLSYNSTKSLMLYVYSAPSAFRFSADGGVSAGTYVNCTANGYPLPTVTWWSNSTGQMTRATEQQQAPGFAALLIPEPTIGGYTQSWICMAVNTYGSYSRTLVLNVTAVATGQSTDDTSTAIRLGVGIGIGVGVPLLVGAIVLIVCLVRRKKNNSKGSGNGTNKTQTTTAPGSVPSTAASRPPQPSLAPPPYNPGPTVSLSPAGSRIITQPSTYQPPVLLEQTGPRTPSNTSMVSVNLSTGRTAGFGALGVTEIRSGGGTPSVYRPPTANNSAVNLNMSVVSGRSVASSMHSGYSNPAANFNEDGNSFSGSLV